MNRSVASLRAVVLVACFVALGGSTACASDAPDFVRDIRPLLEKHCYACHAGDTPKSGLRLDIKEAAFKGGDGWGAAIVPGKADESPLVQFARGDDPDLRMPPKESDVPPLAASDVAQLVAWVEAGAVWPDGVDTASVIDKTDHWAFKPVVRPAVPAVVEASWPNNDIDRFILARLEAEGLKPSPEADRAAWLRRVTFDLTGLPPTPEEVAHFAADTVPGAHERVVERLLASPRYGERYAQHWLDVVRYADTHGYEVNTERPNAWPYRDYCIAAFNADLPYDRFVREQIAGAEPGKEASTGFLVTAAVLLPGQIGADDVSKRAARQDALNDIIVNTSDTVLGLTVGCARCHDHKFDPITARDYYSLQAFFAGVEYGERMLETPEAVRLRKEHEDARKPITEIDRELPGYQPLARVGHTRPAVTGDDDPWTLVADATDRLAFGTKDKTPLAGLSPEEQAMVAALEQEKTTLQSRIQTIVRDTKVFAGSFKEPHPVHLLNRGDAEQRKEELAPESIAAFAGLVAPVSLAKNAPDPDRRQTLAAWLTDPEHPLPARVMVNRIWQWHFGIGLVDTPNDFGRNGSKPTHPALLDWLADEFVKGGWSIKHIHRLILGSATYRQASAATAAGLAKDADARLLWRFPPRRLEAETIRDAILAVSGRLNLEMGGRGFDLFKSRGGLSGFPPIESFDDTGRRRMIYAHKVRMERDDVFGAFDCPDAGQSMARRRQSTTPIQALNLFNSPFTIDEAKAFAERVEGDVAQASSGSSAGDDPVRRQIDRAFQLAYARAPDPVELTAAEGIVREHGLPPLCRVIFNSNEFLFVP